MDLLPFSARPSSVVPNAYETYERPALVIGYVVGPNAIAKGWMVGLDEEGALVPVAKAVCFVGISNESHTGSSVLNHRAMINVTTCGSFVYRFVGWKPTPLDLQRAVWIVDETSVAGAPLRTSVPAGRVVGVEATSDGRPGVRVKIDAAVNKCLPPLPGKVG